MKKKHIATDEFSTHNQIYLKHLLVCLDTNWRGYQRAFAEYETVSTWTNSDEEDQQSISELPTLIRIINSISDRIRSRIKQITAQKNQPVPKPSEIHLAKYEGDYAEWSSWSAQAQSSVLDIDIPIHANIYLILQALGENIAPSIGKAEGRDQSELDRIWGKLQDLCSNPYDRARSHMGSILDLPVLHKPTDKDFRKLIDTVDFQLRVLSRIDFIVDAWDPLIVEILLRKMDKPTIRCWERKRVQQEFPSLKSLLAFFESQVQSIRNLNRSLTESNLPGSSYTNIGSFKQFQNDFIRFKRFQRQDGHENDAHSLRSRDAESRKVFKDTRPSQCRMKCRDHRPLLVELCGFPKARLKWTCQQPHQRMGYLQEMSSCRTRHENLQGHQMQQLWRCPQPNAVSQIPCIQRCKFSPRP